MPSGRFEPGESKRSGHPVIVAKTREGRGSNFCATNVRAKGYMPSVIQGRGKNAKSELISVDALALTREYRKRGRSFENTLYVLQVVDEDGSPVRSAYVLPKNVKYHPTLRFPISLSFAHYNANTGAKVDMPIVFDMSKGKGQLAPLNALHHTVACLVKGNAIPSHIYIDMNEFAHKEEIMWSDLNMGEFADTLRLSPDAYKYAIDKGDLTLATMKRKKRGPQAAHGDDEDGIDEADWAF